MSVQEGAYILSRPSEEIRKDFLTSCDVIDEEVGTGTGKKTGFAHFLGYTPAKEGSVTVRVLKRRHGKKARFPGLGRFSNGTGSILVEYDTGRMIVVFRTPPKKGHIVTVSYKYEQ